MLGRSLGRTCYVVRWAKLLVRWYLRTDGISINFTIETNKISQSEWTILVRRITQISHNKYDPKVVRFNSKKYRKTNGLVQRTMALILYNVQRV